ncbi:MAG: hypothetical protein K2X94_00995 [Amoebophilaceae bacterium]|nr:hypothetical protein [Amoebophilaceae bacterium]
MKAINKILTTLVLLHMFSVHCYGITEIHYLLPKKYTNFAHYLLFEQPQLRRRLEKVTLKSYPPHPPHVDIIEARSSSLGLDTFMYHLVTLDHPETVDGLLARVASTQESVLLKEKLATAYKQYLGSGYSSDMNLYRYVQMANYLITTHKKLIQDFLKKIACFYGTTEMPWREIEVYPCNVQTGLSTIFHNRAVLHVTPNYDFKGDLGTVIHEISHIIYQCQKPAKQIAMERFFMQHPSPYAFMAYQNLNEALATVLGNGLFMEYLTGTEDMAYNDPYIPGFAASIYKDVKHYVTTGKTIDKPFFNLMIKRFAKRFPRAKEDILQAYPRAIIMYHSHTLQLPIDGFFASIVDHTMLKAISENPYYNAASPIVCILKPQEVAQLPSLAATNPYLSHLPLKKLKQVKQQKGLYICRGKWQRPYLFFILDHQEEFDALWKEFTSYLGSAAVQYIPMPMLP